MEMTALPSQLETIAELFELPDRLTEALPWGSGHINDTYLLRFEGSPPCVLQRVNEKVFPDPAAVMDNVQRVCVHLRRKLEERRSSDIERRALQLVPTREGHPYLRQNGDFWRMYPFIERTRSYDQPRSPRQAYEVARGFGEFQELVSDLHQPRLVETIPDFHHTVKRVEQFEEAARNACERAGQALSELEFARARTDVAGRLLEEHTEGRIPERITHNDTKLNNVLLDEHTDEAVCVIDLDTVMPGLALYDFGDLVRSVVNTAAEDEPDTDRVQIDLELFRALTRGYLSKAGSFLTTCELEHLAFSAQVMAYELGIRFLTDHLAGDVYFKTQRPNQNLDRCRVQFRLTALFEEHHQAMDAIVREAAQGPGPTLRT